MIILGNLGVASKKLTNLFLDEWWEFDSVSYKQYHKDYGMTGHDMVQALKYHDPFIYGYILQILEES